MSDHQFPLSSLRFFPLEPAWLEQSAAFSHADPRMEGAYMRVLLAAWRGLPAATIPSSHTYIAQVTRLPVDVVGREWGVLTEGFELDDSGRLRHVALAKLASEMQDRYGKEIQEFALAAAMAQQAPDQFSLVAVEGARGKTRGQTFCPRGFSYSMFPGLLEWSLAAPNGCKSEADTTWLMNRFHDHIADKNPKTKDWAAYFRNWATKEFSSYTSKGMPSRQAAGSALGRTAGGLGLGPATNRAEATRAHNESVFTRVASGGRTAAAKPQQTAEIFEADGRPVPPMDDQAYGRPRSRA